MKTLAAFDPSLHATGVAIFKGKTLSDVYTVRVPSKIIGLNAVDAMWEAWKELHAEALCNVKFDAIVVEVQEYRVHSERSSVPNLLNLSSICAVFYCGVPANRRLKYYPREWKGTMPKAVHHNRLEKHFPEIWEDFTEDEKDAAGLGLFALKKLRW